MTVNLVKLAPETGSVCQWCNDPKKNPKVHTYATPVNASELYLCTGQKIFAHF